MFNTDAIAGAEPGARGVMFGEPGIYKLQGHSVFPFPAISNAITIKVS
jgi:hypothetical protein